MNMTQRTQEEAAKVGLTINSDITKIMMVEKLNEGDMIMIDDREVGSVDEFCYLGNLIRAGSSCDKEVKSPNRKANALVKLERIWKNKGCSIETKI